MLLLLSNVELRINSLADAFISDVADVDDESVEELLVLAKLDGLCSLAYWNTIITQSLHSSTILRQHFNSFSLIWNVLLLNIDSQDLLIKKNKFRKILVIQKKNK